MKSIIFSLFVVIFISGCSTPSEINGEYTLDTPFMVEAELKRNESTCPKDMSSDEWKVQLTETINKQSFEVVIDYPRFESSFIHPETLLPGATIVTIQKAEGDQYIVSDEHSDKEDLLLHYNKSDGSLTGETMKIIKR